MFRAVTEHLQSLQCFCSPEEEEDPLRLGLKGLSFIPTQVLHRVVFLPLALKRVSYANGR